MMVINKNDICFDDDLPQGDRYIPFNVSHKQ